MVANNKLMHLMRVRIYTIRNYLWLFSPFIFVFRDPIVFSILLVVLCYQIGWMKITIFDHVPKQQGMKLFYYGLVITISSLMSYLSISMTTVICVIGFFFWMNLSNSLIDDYADEIIGEK